MTAKMDRSTGRMTVWFRGEIDHHGAAAMREQTDRAIDRLRPPIVRLDFGEVTFMDSSGIGLVMGRYRRLATYGGVMEIAGASERLKRLMTMAGLDRLPIRWIETATNKEEM